MKRGPLSFWLPNLISLGFGCLAEVRWPRPLGGWALKLFARVFRIDCAEAQYPLQEYRSIADFFARSLKPGARAIATEPICPCDGRVRSAGSVPRSDDQLEVKGRGFSIPALLQDPELASRFQDGYAINIYLAPHNYHRVHSPVSGTISELRYIPGSLWPVNEWAFRTIDGVLSTNERVVILIESSFGTVALVMIGATNVGRIDLRRLGFDGDALTRLSCRGAQRLVLPKPQPVQAGDDLGAFRLGSSVVVLFEAATLANRQFRIASEQVVCMGQPLL